MRQPRPTRCPGSDSPADTRSPMPELEPEPEPATRPPIPAPAWSPLPFDHHRLDAFSVARDALVLGDPIARRLPRGYGPLADQVRRALLSAYLQTAEGAHRRGAERLARYRGARGEAGEAAAALEAVEVPGLIPATEVRAVLELLARLCAMLTRLGGPRR